MPAPVGTWRSLVAYLNGVQGVPGSNPGVPTSFPEQIRISVPEAVPIFISWLSRAHSKDNLCNFHDTFRSLSSVERSSRPDQRSLPEARASTSVSGHVPSALVRCSRWGHGIVVHRKDSRSKSSPKGPNISGRHISEFGFERDVISPPTEHLWSALPFRERILRWLLAGASLLESALGRWPPNFGTSARKGRPLPQCEYGDQSNE